MAGRFRTAAAALIFAGQMDSLTRLSEGELTFAASATSHTWWAFAALPIDLGRELIAAAQGSPFVEVNGVLLPDRGWGPPPSPAPGRGRARSAGATAVPPDLTAIAVLDLVRISGLQQVTAATAREVVVLAPGARVAPIIQRGLDLGLDVQYRCGRLHTLFDTSDAAPASRPTATVFEVVLRAEPGSLPTAFLSAIDRDPTVVACRRPGPALLIQHGMASALPDYQLARLAESGDSDGTWVLADAGFGCHRLRAVNDGALHDGAELVRLTDTFELSSPATPPIDGSNATDATADTPANAEPTRPTLRLVRAATRGVAVDALLLDDADLATVPTVLEGQRLADVALLARGRDRHLLLAPGGLLEDLPVGEPLYRIGPGALYLPLGRRIQPSLPPTARASLFGTDNGDGAAVVFAHSDRAYAFDLMTCRPVWRLWAGPLPPIDRQVPPDVIDALNEVERLTAPPAETPPAKAKPRTAIDRIRGRSGPRPTEQPRTWRDHAWDAERAGDLERAAEIHEANGDLRRAAHLYELAAREAQR